LSPVGQEGDDHRVGHSHEEEAILSINNDEQAKQKENINVVE
jgi:hypothetical protein